MIKKLLIGILALTMGACSTLPVEQNRDIPTPAVQLLHHNVFQISVNGGYGSGFWIDSDTMITACHVVGKEYYVYERNEVTKELDVTTVFEIAEVALAYDNTGFYAEYMIPVSCDRDQDIAILKRTDSRTEYEPIILPIYSGNIPIGKTLYGGGFALGGGLTITVGHYQGSVKHPDYTTYSRNSTPTIMGDSGSPLIAFIDNHWYYVGIRQAIRNSGQGLVSHLAMATDGNLIQDHIDENNIER